MYSRKIRRANINAAELLHWNFIVAHSQAGTFLFLNKKQLFIMFVFPLVYLADSPKNFEDCVCYFFASLFFMSKREHFLCLQFL